LNFLLYNVTFFRYFAPLIVEGNRRGIKSRVFLRKESGRPYNCAYKRIDEMNHLASEIGFELIDHKEISRNPGLTFMIEGIGREELSNHHKKVSINFMSDFMVSMKRYHDEVDHIMFQSKFYAEYYDSPPRHYYNNEVIQNTVSEKNLYFGSPKYDAVIKFDAVSEKYGIESHHTPRILIMSPRRNFSSTSDEYVRNLIKALKSEGFTVITKGRAKDPLPLEARGHYYFEDMSIFPHTTQELIEVSDVVISFGSTTSEECLMSLKPYINIDSKPFKHLEFLNEGNYCTDLSSKATVEEVVSETKKMINNDLSNELIEAREKYLFTPGDCSRKALDFLL
jgi:hypothetical protein